MKSVTVYNCAIPQQYAFGNLHYRSMMLKCHIEVVTSLDGKPVDTEACVTALLEGNADVASFPWLESRARTFPEDAFRSRFLFTDPLSLLFPRNELYAEFLRASGVKEGGRLSPTQLRALLSSPQYADTQKLLLREEASGTRQQIERLLGCSVDDNGKLCNTQVDSKHDSTIQIYSEILTSARLQETKSLIGFVSKKIQLLASARREDTDRLLFLDLDGGEREFRVVCRRDGARADSDRVAVLMAEMTRDLETPLAGRVSCPGWVTLLLVASVGALGFYASRIGGYFAQAWPAVIGLLAVVSGISGALHLKDRLGSGRGRGT
jgi:hypothetical protein